MHQACCFNKAETHRAWESAEMAWLEQPALGNVVSMSMWSSLVQKGKFSPETLSSQPSAGGQCSPPQSVLSKQ